MASTVGIINPTRAITVGLHKDDSYEPSHLTHPTVPPPFINAGLDGLGRPTAPAFEPHQIPAAFFVRSRLTEGG